MNPAIKKVEEIITDKGYGVCSLQVGTVGKYTVPVLHNSGDSQKLASDLYHNGCSAYLLKDGSIMIDDSLESLKSAVEGL